jgi:hypothetical protein
MDPSSTFGASCSILLMSSGLADRAPLRMLFSVDYVTPSSFASAAIDSSPAA